MIDRATEADKERTRREAWYGVECSPDIARQADELYAAVMGVQPLYQTPGMCGVRLMDTLMPRSMGRAPVDDWPAPAHEARTARDLSWIRADAAETKAPYLHAYDKNGMYLAACSGVELGLSGLEEIDAPAGFDKALPGYWQGSIDGAGPEWLCTPQVTQALRRGAAVQLGRAHVWRRHGRALVPWYERLRDARSTLLQRLRAAGPGGDPVAAAALDAVKATYTRAIGLLGAGWFTEHGATDSPQFRPDWRHMIISQAAANLEANLTALVRPPLAVHIDCLYYASDEADATAAAPDELRLGGDLGQFKVRYSGVPLTGEFRATLAQGKAARLDRACERALCR